MIDYVADAHAMLWHLFDPRRLGSAARAALRLADEGQARIFLPAVVIAEMIMVVERGRLPGVTTDGLLDVLNLAHESANYTLHALLPNIVFGGLFPVFTHAIICGRRLR